MGEWWICSARGKDKHLVMMQKTQFGSSSWGRQKSGKGDLTLLLQPDQGYAPWGTRRVEGQSLLCIDGRSCSFAESALHLYGGVSARLGQLHVPCTGTISRTNCGRNVILFPSKEVTAFILSKKRWLQNFKWARIPESSSIFTAVELGDLKTTTHSVKKWDFYKYVYQQMNI